MQYLRGVVTRALAIQVHHACRYINSPLYFSVSLPVFSCSKGSQLLHTNTKTQAAVWNSNYYYQRTLFSARKIHGRISTGELVVKTLSDSFTGYSKEGPRESFVESLFREWDRNMRLVTSALAQWLKDPLNSVVRSHPTGSLILQLC